ncbi:MAG TPA: pyridoxamine 5'-phosphate oxidase [Saprospiraceae bacterium]|nr:pyridoxamine 5'-phosphate oxidase [Saprospiraceae bacterium]
MDLSNFRENYTKGGLKRKDLLDDPIEQFELWFRQSLQTDIAEPNAFSLATVSPEGIPSLRTVLLKIFDKKGFVFFTNYKSKKAQDIHSNPNVAMLFPWVSLERQVKIIGKAEKISTAASLKYFLSRPHGSQLGAWVSQQSHVISSRSILEIKLAEMKRKFLNKQVPLPDHWGGYRVIPEIIEFWQGGENRLHDRFEYHLINGEWQINRLAP